MDSCHCRNETDSFTAVSWSSSPGWHSTPVSLQDNLSRYLSKGQGKGKETPFLLLSNTTPARAEPSHLPCQADNKLHLTPVPQTLKHENSHRTWLLQPHGPLLCQTRAGPLVFSAKHQSTSQAFQLARSHKPGRSSAPSDVPPSLPEYSSADKRHARIPPDQPSVEDKLRSEL